MFEIKERPFSEIVETIKDILATDGLPTKYADVAKALNLTPDSLYYHRKHNVIPYENLVKFLAQKKMPINLVLFSQTIEELRYTQNKFRILRRLHPKRKTTNKNNTS